MRSSSGHHFIALDHVRALAAFMVVCWHFMHNGHGGPVPLGAAPLLPFLDEGHTGVALFMTLSGYLFSKLLDGKEIAILPFLWNRMLRLLPLLVACLLLNGIVLAAEGADIGTYLSQIALGFALPTLPNGAWSVTVEFHFYLILPFILLLQRRWALSPVVFVVAAIGLRTALYLSGYDLHWIGYRTLLGHIDQFVLGALAFQFRNVVEGRLAAAITVMFLAGFALFDVAGGFYDLPARFEWIWIILPTFSGFSYAIMIAWYDQHPLRRGKVSDAVGKIGEYSYSIYLLHFFYYVAAAKFINIHVMDISNFYVALPWTILFFATMAGIGHISFKYLEMPFLKLRIPYLLPSKISQTMSIRSSLAEA